MSKYDSKITLLCPACKSSELEIVDSTVFCFNCKGSFTQEQLDEANEDRINKKIMDIYEKEILPDIAKDLKQVGKK